MTLCHLDGRHHLTSPCVSCVLSLAAFEAVSSGTEVDLVRKVTCSAVDIQNNKQYLVMGASGSEVKVSQGLRWVSLLSHLPLLPPVGCD